MYRALRRTTTTSSAAGAVGRPRSKIAASPRPSLRSRGGAAIASTVTGSSCSGSAATARQGRVGPTPDGIVLRQAPNQIDGSRGGIAAFSMRLSRNYHAQALAVLGVALLLVGGCQPNGASGSGAPRSAANGSPVPTPAPDAIKVVTTTTVFADIVSNVGGSRVSASSIIPPGVGPEDYEPKPDDARKLGDADLIVSNGVGLDDFLVRLLANAGGDHPRLVLGDGIPTITVDGEPNPHFWLDPSLVKDYYLPAIVAKLTSVDPGGGPTYRANATA